MFPAARPGRAPGWRPDRQPRRAQRGQASRPCQGRPPDRRAPKFAALQTADGSLSEGWREEDAPGASGLKAAFRARRLGHRSAAAGSAGQGSYVTDVRRRLHSVLTRRSRVGHSRSEWFRASIVPQRQMVAMAPVTNAFAA